MILPLVYYGNPGLREVAAPVTSFDAALRELAENMIETMHAESGIGLAGPQIGVGKRIFVMEIPSEMDVDEAGNRANPDLNGPLVVVNPEIEVQDGAVEEMEEGCLSIPDLRGRVRRPVSILLNYTDLEGQSHARTLHHLAARCALHETDHLNGVLFVDLLSQVKRVAIKGRLKKIKAAYA